MNKFLSYVKKQSTHYRSNNVIVTMGGDFTYQDAAMWYTNLDKLIKYTNLKSAMDQLNITMFYSTPNCYLKAVKDANPSLPTKEDDFFPYASDPTAYWTGYFTSRPTTKYFEREANNYLQMVKQLQVLADLEKHNVFVLNELRSAMGVMQHHDAITGTEKQHVTQDYERILNQAVEDSLIIAKQALNKLSQPDGTKSPLLDFHRCHLNESSCPISENSDKFIVTIYNPLGWAVWEPIRVPVGDGDYKVMAPDGESIQTQIVDIPQAVKSIPTRNSKATKEIVFLAHLKPLGYKSFYIKKTNRVKRNDNFEYSVNFDEYSDVIKERFEKFLGKGRDRVNKKVPYVPLPLNKAEFKKANVDILKDGANDNNLLELEKFLNVRRSTDDNIRYERINTQYAKLNDEELRMLSDEPHVTEASDDEMVLDNQFFKLNVNKATGQIKHLTLPDGDSVNFTVNMYYYPGCSGKNSGPADRASGAYIFRPNATTPTKLKTLTTNVINGDIVKEFRVNLHPSGYMNTKIYKTLNFIENEFIAGPIPIKDDTGKEYIVRYETDILNNGEFYTDSNGRQILKRKLNYRPQYNVSLAEPVAGNYYPVTNEIYIKNDAVKMTVLTDRSEGGTSLIEGQIELMVHRRLLWDDAFGVGEALNETASGFGLVVRGKHRIMLTKTNDNNKKSVLGMHLFPLVLFSDATNLKYEEWLKLNKAYSFINKELPEGIHILTLEPWDGKLLIRLENYLDKSNKSDVEVELDGILKNVDIKNARETTLSANVWIDEYNKWSWNGEVAEDKPRTDGLKVKLRAKEIRTFIAEYEIKK